MGYLARGRLRRLLRGHDRLRPFDAAVADERSRATWQPSQRRPVLAGAVQGELSRSADDDRVGLGRRGRGRGLHPRAAPRRSREPGRVVARRSAGRRLCGAQPAEGESPRPAGAGATTGRARPRRRPSCPSTAWCSTRSRARSSTPTGIGRSAVPAQYDPAARDSVWARCSPRIPSARRGDRACGARRRRRRGAGTRPPWRRRTTPTLMVPGIHDKQVIPGARPRALCRPRRAREGAGRSRLRVAQRDVGETITRCSSAPRSSGSTRGR